MLAHLERLLLSQDVDTIWHMHCDLMAQYGFDRLLYALLPFRASPGNDSVGDALILSNHAPAFLTELLAAEVFLDAPMLRWTLDNEAALSWGVITDRARQGLLTAAEMQVQEMCQRHGVVAGVSLGFSGGSARSGAGMLLCAEPGLSQAKVDEIWASHGRELMVLNSITHLRLSSLPANVVGRTLTERQKEVLEWVADGKTTADIAVIMGLTTATVEKHLRLAREALDVETTAQAVLKAVLYRQLFAERIGQMRPETTGTCGSILPQNLQ